MKSIVYGPENIPCWQEQRQPKPNHHQVLVKVHAVGLNPVDAKGVIGDKLPHNWTTLQGMARRCIVRSQVIGFDFAGTVVEAGRAVQEEFQPGDPVYGIMPPSRYGGTLQEQLSVPSVQLAKLPSSVPLATAAALPLVGITAYQCLTDSGWDCPSPEHSPKLLVLGASGGTGHVAVQVGRCLQPEAPIVAVCSSRNVDFVQSLAENLTVLDYCAPDFLRQLRAHGPFDVVMDCVTSGDPRDQATINYQELLFGDNQLLTPHSQYRRLGGAFSDWWRAGMERTVHIKLWSNPRAKLFWIQMHNTAPTLRQLAAWMEQEKVKPHIAETIPFTPEGIEQGFVSLLKRRVVGKLVVTFPVAVAMDSSQAKQE